MIRAGLALLALTACTDPRLGLGIALGPGGVSVRPSLSTTIGGVGVGASVPIP
jgi:hypothetical protein